MNPKNTKNSYTKTCLSHYVENHKNENIPNAQQLKYYQTTKLTMHVGDSSKSNHIALHHYTLNKLQHL